MRNFILAPNRYIYVDSYEYNHMDKLLITYHVDYTKVPFKFQVWTVHKELSAIGPMFSIAAAFGNVHGVYQAGNVTLQPER